MRNKSQSPYVKANEGARRNFFQSWKCVPSNQCAEAYGEPYKQHVDVIIGLENKIGVNLLLTPTRSEYATHGLPEKATFKRAHKHTSSTQIHIEKMRKREKESENTEE